MADGDGIVVDLDEAAPAAAPAPVDPDVVELPEGDGAAAAPGAVRLPAHAVTLADGRVRLPLRFPVTLRLRQAGTVREESFEALVMRRMNGADLRALASAGEAAAVVAIARLCGIPHAKAEALHDRMDVSDVLAFTEVLGFFGGIGRTTGR